MRTSPISPKFPKSTRNDEEPVNLMVKREDKYCVSGIILSGALC
jgi:hypothetical protein